MNLEASVVCLPTSTVATHSMLDVHHLQHADGAIHGDPHGQTPRAWAQLLARHHHVQGDSTSSSGVHFTPLAAAVLWTRTKHSKSSCQHRTESLSIHTARTPVSTERKVCLYTQQELLSAQKGKSVYTHSKSSCQFRTESLIIHTARAPVSTEWKACLYTQQELLSAQNGKSDHTHSKSSCQHRTESLIIHTARAPVSTVRKVWLYTQQVIYIEKETTWA